MGCCRGVGVRANDGSGAMDVSGDRHAYGGRRVMVWSQSPGVSTGMGRGLSGRE
jgi:hypothetical protein